MKKYSIWLAGLTIMAASLAFADAPKIDRTRINILLKRFEAQMQEQPNAPAPDKAKLQADITYRLQTSELLKAEAIKAGLDKNPEIQAAWQNMQAQFYANQYVEYLAANTQISDSDLRQQYELINREVNPLAIYFPTKEAAEEGLVKLKKGLAYETLLKQTNPKAPTTNWTNIQKLPSELADLVIQLGNGQIAPNVLNIGGKYFLLKLAGVRPASNGPAFDQIKDQLKELAKQEKIQKQINDLLRKNGIKPPELN